MEKLPSELISVVAAFLSPRSLIPFANLYPWECAAALRVAPCLTTLAQLNALIDLLEQDERKLAETATLHSHNDNQMQLKATTVASLEIRCREHNQKWAHSASALLRLCNNTNTLVLDGIEDLRIKSIVGTGALKHLHLRSVSFRAHSLPSSPSLNTSLANVTTMTLNNLGLPLPSTHFANLLLAAPRLSSLSISNLRDVTPELFILALEIVQPYLTTLKIGSTTTLQGEELPDILANFEKLVVVDLTLPTIVILLSLPSTVETLTVRKVKDVTPSQEDETVRDVEIALRKPSFCKHLKLLSMWRTRGLRRIEDASLARSVSTQFI